MDYVVIENLLATKGDFPWSFFFGFVMVFTAIGLCAGILVFLDGTESFFLSIFAGISGGLILGAIVGAMLSWAGVDGGYEDREDKVVNKIIQQANSEGYVIENSDTIGRDEKDALFEQQSIFIDAYTEQGEAVSLLVKFNKQEKLTFRKAAPITRENKK